MAQGAPGVRAPPGQSSLIIEGFERLKTGSLLVILSLALTAAAVASAVGVMGFGFGMPGHEGEPGEAGGFGPLAMASAPLAIAVLASILGIAGWVVLLGSAGRFAEYDRVRFGKGETAARLVAGGFLAVLLGIAAAGAGLWPAALAIVVLGGLAVLLGNVIFALFVSDLARLRQEDGLPVPDGFRTAGTLLLLGTLLYIPMITMILGAILQVLAVIMIFIYSKEAVDALTIQARQGPALP